MDAREQDLPPEHAGTVTTPSTVPPTGSDPRFPIGPFSYDVLPTEADRARNVERIAALPAELRAAVAGATEGELEGTYRAGGWTVRQLVHHLPDSHLNGYARFKLALTEETPTIKPYDEARWAALPDVRSVPIETSLRLLEALHARWAALLHAMTAADFARGYVHPEHGRTIPLDQALASYAWHGRHHLAHIRIALHR